MSSSNESHKLSTRQMQILQFITKFVVENKFPPTIREIGDKVGISSTSVTNYNLARLEELHLITRQREVSRGLSINWERLDDFSIPGLAEIRVGASKIMPMPDMNRFIRVPMLGSIAAGQPILVEPADLVAADEYVELAAGFVRDTDRLFALRVKGNSMIDAGVLDGDIVILRHQETANEGEMVAAWIEGSDGPDETTLKYFHRRGRTVELRPANPEYRPIERPANRVQIKGKVVSVVRLYQ